MTQLPLNHRIDSVVQMIARVETFLVRLRAALPECDVDQFVLGWDNSLCVNMDGARARGVLDATVFSFRRDIRLPHVVNGAGEQAKVWSREIMIERSIATQKGLLKVLREQHGLMMRELEADYHDRTGKVLARPDEALIALHDRAEFEEARRS